jgi:hypothetical protein
MTNDRIWVVEMPDPEACTGQSVARVLHELSHRLPCVELLVYGLRRQDSELILDPESWLSLRMSEAVNLVAKISQLDWADFFFVDGPDQISAIKNAPSFREAIATATATLQVADNSYIFVFTPSEELARSIALKMPNSAVTQQGINDLKLMF